MNKDIKNIKGVIFDLDGTLLDSMHIWSDIGLLFLKNKGIFISKKETRFEDLCTVQHLFHFRICVIQKITFLFNTFLFFSE